MTARCLSTLKATREEQVSAPAARRLAGARRRFPGRLELTRAELVQVQVQQADRMSISGVQDKVSLRLQRGRLVPTEAHGEFILKPLPSAPIPSFADQVAANEHTVMQLAEQVFGISTPPNTLVRLADGELAYLCRRFDTDEQGNKLRQEDFTSLCGRTADGDGPNFKYEGSYEQLGQLLDRHCSAAIVQKERLFQQVVFNFLVGNGDAHLKNFSLIETSLGDFVLSPAYDLLCTTLHFPNESPLALDLFADDFESDSFQANGHYSGVDFELFAERLGLQPVRAARVLDGYIGHAEALTQLVSRSFLTPEASAQLLDIVTERRRLLARRG